MAYKFSRRDMENHVVTSKIYELIKLQEAGYGTMKMTDVEIAHLFQTETMKVFTDILYYDNKHILMAKTW